MLGKTHFAIGIAAATAVMQPQTAPECLTAVLAGSVGGVLCDIDNLRNEGKTDSIVIQLFAAATAACALTADHFMQGGILASALSGDRNLMIAGGMLFAIAWIAGYFASHRGFTHSIAALVLFSAAAQLILPAAGPGFAAAYASHLALDLTNKKGMQLLFPLRKRFCLKLFYADKSANILFFQLGILGALFLMLNSTVMHLFY